MQCRGRLQSSSIRKREDVKVKQSRLAESPLISFPVIQNFSNSCLDLCMLTFSLAPTLSLPLFVETDKKRERNQFVLATAKIIFPILLACYFMNTVEKSRFLNEFFFKKNLPFIQNNQISLANPVV